MQDNLKPDEDILYQRAYDLKALGIQPYAREFERSHTLLEINENYEAIGSDIPGKEGIFTLCGRVMSFKQFQEDILVVIADQDATLQLVISKDKVTAKAFNLFASYVYEGDYLGFTVDYLYREQGYLTGVVKAWTFLALANIPIPKDLSVERKRAHQHLYLASKLSAREIIVTRGRMLRFIRHWLAEEGVIEVNTAQSTQTAVTNALLQYVIGGVEQVYEIAPISNAQPIDWLNHSHVFWLHCCMALKTPQHMMSMVERLLNRLALHLHSTSRLMWHPLDRMNPAVESGSVELVDENHVLEIDMSVPWARCSLYQIMNDVLDIDFTCMNTPEQALDMLRRAGIQLNMLDSDMSIPALAQQVFYEYVALTFIQPTFVVFPAEDANESEWFELYINGILLASGHSEVTDPAVWSANCEVDERFQEKLMIGMPPVSSLSLNLDRLAMFLIGATDIRDVVYFLAH